jgi:uncharacterized membrane protein YhaH (DUF805 family)
MDWTWYLFRFDGRIGRARLWYGMLIIFCWMIFALAVVAGVGMLFGGAGPFALSLDDVFRIADPATYRSPSSAPLPVLAVKAAATSLFLWMYLAISIKRLHDRDKSGWWMVPFFVVPGLFDQFSDRLGDSYLLLVARLIAGAPFLWGFVELFCLRGSSRTNRFGPDPLAKTQTSPDSRTGATSRATGGWDQQSELDFVPHRAGPSPSPAPHVKREHD